MIDSSTPIIVYQMGKVGSTSIYKSLLNSKVNVFQVHRLHPDNLNQLTRVYLEKGMKLHNWMRVGKDLYDKYILNNVPIKLIVPIREPISRNISAFFEQLELFMGKGFNPSVGNVDLLISQFKEKYYHDIPLKWFDNEFFRVTDIDIFKYDFPRKDGYIKLEKGIYNILILKSEIDDPTKARIIQDFIGLKEFKLQRFYEGTDKAYSEVYKIFKSNILIDPEYINYMYSSQYAQHFYDENELQHFRNKFMRNTN